MQIRQVKVVTRLMLLLGTTVGIGTIAAVSHEVTLQRHNRQLLSAIKANDTKAVLSLLQHGADANACEADEKLATFWQTLLATLRSKPRERQGSHALYVAMGEYGLGLSVDHVADIRIFQALVKAGADVNARGHQGVTPLMIAIVVNRPDVAKLLLDAGADINVKDVDGYTAYFLAQQRAGFDIGRNTAFVKLIEQARNSR